MQQLIIQKIRMAYKDDKKAKKDEIMAQIEALKPKKELKDLIDLLLIEWQEVLDQHTAAVADDCINRYRNAESAVGTFVDDFMGFLISQEMMKPEWTAKDIERIKKGFKAIKGIG